MKNKPWLKSTGPKTFVGKEKSSMNALKIDPETYAIFKEYKQLMIEQKKIYNIINQM